MSGLAKSIPWIFELGSNFMIYPLISKKFGYRNHPPTVSVTEFKDLADIKVPQHSDLKLLPPTAGRLQTSLHEWFDKRYSVYL